jgi:proteasome assembly chaperone (PAC2) family protein
MTVLLVFVAIVAAAVGYIIYRAKKSTSILTTPLIDKDVLTQLETASKQVDGMIKKIDEVLADQSLTEQAPKPAKKKRRYYPKKK